jgi:hypothetical protein
MTLCAVSSSPDAKGQLRKHAAPVMGNGHPRAYCTAAVNRSSWCPWADESSFTVGEMRIKWSTIYPDFHIIQIL